MNGKVVVGYDGSDMAKAALGKAIDLAKAGDDGEVTIVCGQDRPPHWVTYRGPAVEMNAYLEQLDKEIIEGLEEASKVVADAGVKAATTCTREHPVDLMIRIADEVGAEAIVVGAKGSGSGHDVVLGSTTMKILHHSDVPVVVVPYAE